MKRSGLLVLALSPMLVAAGALMLPAQKSGGGTATGGASSGTGSRPASPPRVTNTDNPQFYGGVPVNPYYNFPTSSEPHVDPMLARLLKQERQKQVVRDTDRLVKLTTQYQAEVQAAGPTASSDKHLKEIEKLAREVRTTLMQ